MRARLEQLETSSGWYGALLRAVTSLPCSRQLSGESRLPSSEGLRSGDGVHSDGLRGGTLGVPGSVVSVPGSGLMPPPSGIPPPPVPPGTMVSAMDLNSAAQLYGLVPPLPPLGLRGRDIEEQDRFSIRRTWKQWHLEDQEKLWGKGFRVLEASVHRRAMEVRVANQP